MNNEEQTLDEAKKLVHYIPLQDRLNQMQVILQGIKLQEIKIARLDIHSQNNDALEVYSDDLEEKQEKLLNTLRGLKNSFRLNEAALHDAMKKTKEV